MIHSMATKATPEPSNASKLYERLEKWQTTPHGVTVLDHRDEGKGWWQAHVETMGWLDDLAHMLEHVEANQRQIERLKPGLEAARRAVLSTDHQMNGANNHRQHLTDAELSILSGAVLLVDTTGVPLDVAGALTELLPFIDEARTLIESADLDGEARSYLLELVNRLSQALHGVGVRGESDVRRWASELIGALAIYATGGDIEQRNKFRDFMDRFGPKVKSFLVHEVPAAIASGAADAAIQAITGG